MRPILQTITLLAVTSLLLVLVPGTSRGDNQETLILRDGQQWMGVSRGIVDGMLRWELPTGESITIPVDGIERIEFPAPASNASVMALFAHTAGLPDIPPEPSSESPSGGTTPGESPPAAGNGATPDSVTPPAGNTQSPIAADPANPGTYETVLGNFGADVDEAVDYWNSWTKRFEIGGRSLRGNTDEDFFNMGLKLEKKSDHRFAQIESGGQFSQRLREATSNRWFANGTIDFNKQTEDRWVWFAVSKNEFDEFENLSYRGSLSTGLGYRFFNEPKKRLVTRLGPGVTYERFFDPVNSRVTPDLFGEIEALWPLYDRTSFEHKTSIYPSLENMEVFRFVSTYGLLIALDEAERWSLKLGLRHEYNSQPNSNLEKSDYTASFMLVYTRN